jgi:hypothetical protein
MVKDKWRFFYTFITFLLNLYMKIWYYKAPLETHTSYVLKARLRNIRYFFIINLKIYRNTILFNYNLLSWHIFLRIYFTYLMAFSLLKTFSNCFKWFFAKLNSFRIIILLSYSCFYCEELHRQRHRNCRQIRHFKNFTFCEVL